MSETEEKLAIAVEALNALATGNTDGFVSWAFARDALSRIKNDSAPSELADTKRRLESCLSLHGHACGTSPSPTWPYVLEFARRMEKKLDANRHKGNREGWINDDPASLIRRIQGETDELIGAIHKGQNAQRIADEAADIANFCMMAADWFLAREEPPQPKNQE